MKEFLTKQGGRHIFNEDFDHLQDIALSCVEFLKDSGLNFVISGCVYNSDTQKVGSGVVFLDGRLRRFEETDVSDLTLPFSIVTNDSTSNDVYEDGNTGVAKKTYGTSIIGSDSVAPAIRIQSDSQGVFLAVIDSFYSHYLLVKNNKAQSISAIVSFMGVIRAINSKLVSSDHTINTSVSNAGEVTILFKESSTERMRITIGVDGTPIQVYKNGSLLYQFGNKSGSILLKNILVRAIAADKTVSTRYVVGGNNISDRFFTIQEWGDTGWLNIQNSSGNDVAGLFVRKVHCMVYIQGTLPTDFFTKSNSSYGIVFKTKYKLPSGIPLPPDLNICHLHTVGYVNIVSTTPSFSGNCCLGCAVMLDEDGYFRVAQNEANPRSDTNQLNNSFPTFEGSKLSLLAFPQNVNSHVSWQYPIDMEASAAAITYVQAYAAAYNPDSNLVHSYCLRYKYTDGVYSGYDSYNLVKAEYRRSGSGDSWTQIQIEWRTDTVEWYEVIGGVEVLQPEKMGSDGFLFINDTKFSRDVRLTYSNGRVMYVTVIDSPPTHSIDIVLKMGSASRYIIPGDGRGQVLRPDVHNYRHSYYEVINGGSKTIHNKVTNNEGGELNFTEGGQYITKVGDHYEWTDVAINATQPFRITVVQVESGKTCTITVDASRFKPSNNTSFVSY